MRHLAFAVVVVLTLAAIHHAPEPARRDDDGRAATVVDRHGLAFVQAAGRTRWTPLGRREPLLAGDAIRTDLRGANAVEIELAGGGRVLVGPDTRIELGPRSIHVLRGECEVDPGETPVKVTGPGKADLGIGTRTVLRATAGALQTLDKDPRWLSGYRESTTSEWMGSLVAQVDGRDVPLAIREHRVDVTIRDAVAETTIEQVYANATRTTLEGSFTFPLPPGASVSGFAMWVGDEQVEADIVERSRARQIYEDLKRRKVDPGLLEWSGGNLFTARVWPIPAQGEKRVRVRYTQLLPLEGTTLRWSTALRSEAMRAKPVRHVQVHAEVASSRKLVTVGSPTHEVSTKHTERSATLDWDAQDFTPDRDFELRVELAESAPLTVVEHVRDGQGYFAAMITPPGENAGWTRPATPEGTGVELVLVCDTSGSMDAPARSAQREVVAALLGSLGANDRFRLLGSDYKAAWFDPGAVPADAAHVAAALDFLDARPSLGWTDLDLAFATALESAGKGAVVVYVGDGMVTRGDADGSAFARRCAQLLEGHEVTLDAVAVSNAIDAQVLDAITRAGHGTYVEAGDDVPTAALAILGDALGPKLQDVHIAFEGIDVARVLPDVLPNIAVGRERIVVGRYQPKSEVQSGRVVVEARLGGKPVRYERACSFGPGDPVCSWLPRLWVQRHIEKLIADGLSPQSRADVIALSAEFQVMTPLTSFLVLESDADRERYGVTRRIKMRDGETFFAQARDQARADRTRTALADAAQWRVALRQSALREIAELGRSQAMAVAIAYPVSRFGLYRGPSDAMPAGRGGEALRGLKLAEAGAAGDDFFLGAGEPVPETTVASGTWDDAIGNDFAGLEAARESLDGGDLGYLGVDFEELADKDELTAGLAKKVSFHRRAARARQSASDVFSWYPDESRPALAAFGFPGLARFAGAPIDSPDPEWPAELIAMVRALDKRAALRALDGVDIARTVTTMHGPTGRVTERAHTRTVWSRGGYVVRSEAGRNASTHLSLAIDGRRREIDVALGLGRDRPVAEGELDDFAAWLPAGAGADFSRSLADHSAKVLSDERTKVVLELRSLSDPTQSRVLTLDLKQYVLLSMVSYSGTRRTGDITVESVIHVDGVALPGRVVSHDAEGRVISVEEITARRVQGDELRGAVAAARDGESGTLFVDAADPLLVDSREAVHARTARVQQMLSVLADLLQRSRKDEAVALWKTLSGQLGGNLAAMTWIGLDVEASTGFRGGYDGITDSLCRRAPGADTFFLVQRLLERSAPALGPNERLALHDRIRPALFCDGEDADAKDRDLAWRLADARLWRDVGDKERALGRALDIAQKAPWNLEAQQIAANWCAESGHDEQAEQIDERALAADSLWTRDELDGLYATLCQLHWSNIDLAKAGAVADRWIASGTASHEAHALRLAVMLYQGKLKEAVADVDATLAADLDIDGKPSDLARFDAALRFLLGDGWRFSRSAILPDDLPRLESVVRKYLVSSSRTGLARVQWILANDGFRRTDAGRGVLAEMRGWFGVASRVEQMPFLMLDLALQYLDARELSDQAWTEVVANLPKRIAATTNRFERDRLAQHYLALCDRRDAQDLAITFQRTRLEDAASRLSRPGIANDLLQRLTRQPWSTEREDEILGLCTRTLDPFATTDARAAGFISILRWSCDQLQQMRQTKELGPVGELEKLPRKERRAKEVTATANAQRSLAARLATYAGGMDPALRVFATVEAACFAAQSTDDRDTLRIETVAALDSIKDRDIGDGGIRVARRRLSLVLSHLAVRRGTSTELVDGVLADYASRSQRGTGELDWRAETARLLTALDRDEALLIALGQWIAPARLDQHWRTLRGWLLASRGDFAAARTDLDRLASDTELSAFEWNTLGGWRLAAGDEAGWTAANIARFDAMDEWSLRGVVQSETSRLQRKPDAIDPLSIEAARSLLRKCSNPQWMLQQVMALYKTSKDPRVLGALPAILSGHSPEQTYIAMGSLRDALNDVHEEAALDEMQASIDRMRKAFLPSDTDFVEIGPALATYLCQGRAARVPNGNGEHRRAMLSALDQVQRGVHSSIAPNARYAIANFLTGLGELPGEDERIRRIAILTTLAQLVPPASLDDLRITTCLAQALWIDGARDRAIETMDMLLRRAEQDAGGGIPEQAMPQVDVLVDWLTASGRHGEAETRVKRWRDGQPTPMRRDWYEDRLDRVYASAITSKGTTSLGSGARLFDAAATRLEKRLAVLAAGRARATSILQLYSALCRAASAAKAGDPGQRLSDWAATGLDALLARCPTAHADLIYTAADTLDDIGSKHAALALFVKHCLNPPPWNLRVGVDLWNRFDWRIADLRHKLGDLGDLRADLRALVLRELERDLVSVGRNYNPIWRSNDQRFWNELRGEFLAVAGKVLELHPKDPAIVAYTAGVLHDSLGDVRGGVRALQSLQERELLALDHRAILAGWLMDLREFDAALPHLRILVDQQPGMLQHHLYLITALGKTGKLDAARTALGTAIERFTEFRTLTDSAEASLAFAARDAGLSPEALEHIANAIHTRERSRATSADNTLSEWYSVYAGMLGVAGHEDDAVEAAGASIVACGENQPLREQRFKELTNVLGRMRDLDGWLGRYDARAKESGVDAPILRKALASVMRDTGAMESAAKQLRLAIALDPRDLSTYRDLLAVLDGLARTNEALDVAFAALAAAPSDLDVIADLAARLERAKRIDDAQRAWSDLVERQPHEADGHRRLAEQRAKQDRDGEAIEQWQQVVRTRPDDPQGFLSLARAQLHAKDRDAANATFAILLARDWGNDTVAIRQAVNELMR